MAKPLILVLKEKIMTKKLFEGKSDIEMLGEINLNDNTKDFDYIEITLKISDNEKTIKINNPSGKTFWEELPYTLSDYYAKAFSRFLIKDNKIISIADNCGYYTINYLNSQVNMHLNRTNYIRIKEVIGGKYYSE